MPATDNNKSAIAERGEAECLVSNPPMARGGSGLKAI